MPVILETQEQADDLILAEVFRRQKKALMRSAKAQALAWNALDRDVQESYLTAVDRLEANRG